MPNMPTFESRLETAIHNQLQTEIAEMREEFIKKALIKFEAELRTRVASTALGISSYISMDSSNSNLVIHVKMDK